MPRNSYTRERFGPVMEKVLLLLGAGITLSLTTRPDYFFKVIESAQKEWKKINERSLRNTIRKLYWSKLVDCRERSDGTVKMILSQTGKKKTLEFKLDTMKIKTPKRWDGLWRIIIFDIPEYKKKARDALSARLKTLGLIALQKSVFVYPHNCKDEVDFLIELFDLRPFVRFIVAKEIDNELHLKKKFYLA